MEELIPEEGYVLKDHWAPLAYYDLYDFVGNVSSPQFRTDDSLRKFNVYFELKDAFTNVAGLRFIRAEGKIYRFFFATGSCIMEEVINQQNKSLTGFKFDIDSTNIQSAIWLCDQLLGQFLSHMAIVFGGSYTWYTVTAYDTKHNICLKSTYDQYAALVPEIEEPNFIGCFSDIKGMLSDSHYSLFSIYREGRNSSSPFYKLLCSYKVLEGVIQHAAFQGTDKKLIELQINQSERRKKMRITEEHLKLARASVRFPEYISISFVQFREKVLDTRNKIAHALSNDKTAHDFDNAENKTDITILANLTDLCAREILCEEIRLLRLIYNNTNNIDPAE